MLRGEGRQGRGVRCMTWDMGEGRHMDVKMTMSAEEFTVLPRADLTAITPPLAPSPPLHLGHAPCVSTCTVTTGTASLVPATAADRWWAWKAAMVSALVRMSFSMLSSLLVYPFPHSVCAKAAERRSF